MAHELKTDLARSFAYQAGITLDELLAVSPGHLVTWAGSAREAWLGMKKAAAMTPAEKLADLKSIMAAGDTRETSKQPTQGE